MARDVLSILVSTVASKSTFSVGRWVIDQFRSALKLDVEALVCSRDWLYAHIGNIYIFLHVGSMSSKFYILLWVIIWKMY